MNQTKIAVIGLGYVGLPLAVEFAKKFPVVGFDINQNRVNELNAGHDATLEVEDDNLHSVLVIPISGNRRSEGSHEREHRFKTHHQSNRHRPLQHTSSSLSQPQQIRTTGQYLTPLIKASETVGKVLKKTILLFTNLLFIPEQQKKIVFPFWNNIQD